MAAKAQKISTHGNESLSMASEDYLEAIYCLTQEKKQPEAGIHSVEVAEQLGVSKASVNKGLVALRNAGMIDQVRYGHIILTEKGKQYGCDIWRRHRTLRAFLTIELGVDPERANDEACAMEHDLSADTMARWIKYLENNGIYIED